MNQATPAPHGQGGLNLTPSDIYFILFRHKKKIVLFALLGLIAGATVYKSWPEEYQSNAQLLVRYVTEKRDVVDSREDTRVTSAGDRGGENILNTEIAILTSLDLAETVAEKIGPEKIILEVQEEPNAPILYLATRKISNGINAKILANVINIQYASDDPSLTRPILQTLIESYVEKHVQVHRGTGGTFDDFLTQQTDRLKATLNQTENELLKTLKKAGVLDIHDAKLTLATEMARIQQTILEAEVELAENRSLLSDTPAAQSANSDEDNPAETGEEVDKAFNESLANAVEEYENTRTRIEILKTRERTLLMSYTDANSLVKGVRSQIKRSEEKLQEIIANHPTLNQPQGVIATASGTSAISQTDFLMAQAIRVKALQAKLRVLGEQLTQLKVKAEQIEDVQVAVNELERRKDLEEANYQNFLTSLERTRLEEALSSGKINNISIIQNPSPVTLVVSEKSKFAGVAFIGLAAIGIGWAFLMELLLDRTIKRPIEIQREIGIPLFLTVPDTNGKVFKKLTRSTTNGEKQILGKLKAAKSSEKAAYSPKSSTLKAAAKSNPEYYGSNKSTNGSGGEIAPWDIEHPLHNYFEALRDKVIGFFESKNLKHKPKLIGLTGLGENPGVSTLASGIAGSLSKTEGGNVLLVDMTLGKESAHQFYKGEEITSLEEALQKPEKAQLQKNLYVVAEGSNGYKLPSLLPSRFNSIIPQLKASEFDYIVFDMPAVSPISATPRLSSFMDVMLMVIESEKTDREVVKQAVELLTESQTHLGAILNKTKSYVPKQLEQDFIGLS